MSEKIKELKQVIEFEKKSFEKLLKKQTDEIGKAHTEGMIDAYNNVILWMETK